MNTTSFQTSSYSATQQNQVLGQSGLKILAGEDLTSGDRKRIQQMQSESWYKQQIDEKQRRQNAKKAEKQAFDQQTLQTAEYRRQLQQQKAQRLYEMQVAAKQQNLQQLNQKINRQRLTAQQEADQKLGHTQYIKNHPFYTEDPATCKSYLGNNRVLPYHWKGMSEEQRQRILEEQDKQVQQKKLQKQIEDQQNKLFAQQMEAQRKALVLADRAKNKGIKDVRKGMDEYNRLKAEEMKKKAYQAFEGVQTYKNQ